ncbi:MAG: ABC transporter ATP-binding protein [Actinomycetota bacterium]|nr:ABC transporter ATP-binding protein [Actinomycetota bacterium]
MAEPLLEVSGLNAFYGRAHVLHDVEFQVGAEPVAIIGRNGMGKTTLCNAIMGLLASAAGSVRFRGQELLGRPSYKIAGAGLGYVPQGRRLFPSLSTDEHLQMIRSRNGGRWSVRAVYDLFPRLAERKRISAAQLSGGEQQMLAIGRALLTNPSLLIMDEPSEGLAPAIIEALTGTIRELVEEGMTLLLIEQNLGVATSVAERQLVMIAGHIATETTADALVSDPNAQRRYLGVEPLAEAH